MKKIDLGGVYLQDVKNFLLAAELLNFSAVGRVEDITPSAVLKSIARLENATNLILFSKHSGKVRLTPAGKMLKEKLSAYISSFEDAVMESSYIQEGQNRGIKIGVPSENNMSDIFRNVYQLKQKLGNINVSVSVHDFPELRARILDGSLDVIFSVLFETDAFKNTDVSWKLIKPVRLCIYVPDTNPLFSREQLSIANLKSEKFIIQSQSMTTGYLNLLFDLCKPYGFTPIIGKYAENLGSFVASLMFDEGILIGDELMTELFSENIKCFPIEGTKSGQIIAWNKTQASNLVQEFVKGYNC